jgi:transposase-like protein
MSKGLRIAPAKKAAALKALQGGAPLLPLAKKYRVTKETLQKWAREAGDGQTESTAAPKGARKTRDAHPMADALVHLKRARALATKADFASEAFLNCMLALTRLERGS